MNIYEWRPARVMRNYGSGYIIVAAETVEEARKNATIQFEAWCKENWKWYDDEYNAEMIEQLKEDISIDPIIYDVSTVIYITGSD